MPHQENTAAGEQSGRAGSFMASKRGRGTYYTPRYVVDFILKTALDSALSATSKAGEGVVRVVDPACGRGAFLTRAYERLLDWHVDGGVAPAREERLCILKDCIYGVDVDEAAVDATRRRLLHLACDGRPIEGIADAILSSNIKCGDALIGPDFRAREALPAGARPFDWQREFPAVSEHGGFDVVVGNPPYLSFFSRESIRPPAVVEAYLARRFSAEVGGRLNTYLLFLVQGLRLLRTGGWLGMIVPETLASNESYEALRRRLTAPGGADREAALRFLGELDFSVFRGVTVGSLVVVVGPGGEWCTLARYASRRSVMAGRPEEKLSVERSLLGGAPGCRWSLEGAAWAGLLGRIESRCAPLEQVAEVRDGINPGTRSFRERIVDPAGPARPTWRPLIQGRHVHRYHLEPSGQVVDYDPGLLTAELRRRGASLREPRIFSGPKLVSRQTADRLMFAFDGAGHCALNSVHNTLARDGRRETLHYLLAILNSKLMNFYYRCRSRETGRGFPQVHISQLRRLPVAPATGAHRTLLAGLAEQATRMSSSAAGAQVTGATGARIAARKAVELRDRIDREVYGLYGLSAGEIEIVERGAPGGRPAAD